MPDSKQQLKNGPHAGMSQSVSSSLLERLREQDPDAWRWLVRVYYPLVRGWCQRSRLQAEDAADVAQEVFRVLAGNVARFRREGRQNSFRGWLWGITRRQLLAHWRQHKLMAAGGTAAQQRFEAIPAPEVEEPSAQELVTDRQQLLRRALELLRPTVEDRTWQAFWRAAVEGHAPAGIAADLGISVNAVYAAKCRLLRRLRDEFGDLLD